MLRSRMALTWLSECRTMVKALLHRGGGMDIFADGFIVGEDGAYRVKTRDRPIPA
jgi:hypothetical protein